MGVRLPAIVVVVLLVLLFVALNAVSPLVVAQTSPTPTPTGPVLGPVRLGVDGSMRDNAFLSAFLVQCNTVGTQAGTGETSRLEYTGYRSDWEGVPYE